MLEKTFQKAMGFLQQPKKSFDGEKKTELSDAFVYLLIVSLVSAILSGVVALFNPLGAFFLIVIVGGYVGGIIGAVIGGLWIHLWAYVFGAKKGLNQTFKTVFFGGTPNYLLGWIPLVNILAALYSIYLYWIGLQRLQAMPGDKAAWTIVIAIIIPLVVIAVLAAALFAFLIGSGFQGDMGSMMFQNIPAY